MTMDQIAAEVSRIEEAKALARELFPEQTFPNVVRQPVWFGKKKVTQAEGKIALVDMNTDNLYAICSNRYNLVLHEEVIRQVYDAVQELPEHGTPRWDLRLPYEGGKMVLKVSFPEMRKSVKVGDEIISEITFRSSYDLEWKLRSDAGVRRLVCSNGATIAVKGKEFGYINRHISTLDLSVAVETMKQGLIAFSEKTELWKKWAEMKVNEELYNEVWEALPFSENEKKKMEELPEAGSQLLLPAALKSEELTMWDMHSVVTQFVTHSVESEARKADLEPVVARTFDNFAARRMAA